MTGTNQKQIQAMVEKGVNYIFHLMAVSRVGFDSEYADLYKDSIIPQDLESIQKHRDLLSFGFGSGGDLVPVIIFIPAYLNLESVQVFEEYFSLINEGIDKGEFGAIFKRYAFHFDKLKIWFSLDLYDQYFHSLEKYHSTILTLGEIICRNLPYYENGVWIKEKDEITVTASKINDYFAQINTIIKWEDLTHCEFKFDKFQVVLCSAIKNGPNADSLGYDRVVFFSGRPPDYTRQMISHEVGTHLLIDIMKDVNNLGKFEFKTVYGAYECLLKFYNRIILEDVNLAYNISEFKEMEILDIYGEIFNDNPQITPKELLMRGIEAFINQ
jgi:hypothetical protein